MDKKPLPYWIERAQSLSAYILIIGSLFLVGRGLLGFFPKHDATSRTAIKTIESGGSATITNINNPTPDYRQGLYLRGASDRASLGVFKQVTNNIRVSAGAGKNYDSDAFVEVGAEVSF